MNIASNQQQADSQDHNINYPMAIGIGILGALMGAVAQYYSFIFLHISSFYLMVIGGSFFVMSAVFYGSGKSKKLSVFLIGVFLCAVMNIISQKYIYAHQLNLYAQTHLSQFGELKKGQLISVSFMSAGFINYLQTPQLISSFIASAFIWFRFFVRKNRSKNQAAALSSSK